MISNQVLLSICIPTYNRSQYLKKSIDSIISQKEFCNGLVEIVISDNASTDDTEDIVREYTEKFQNIHYSKNIENIRDKNFPLVLSKAHGKMRRLCNDTLLFHTDALEKMCSIIQENENSRPFIFWENSDYGKEHTYDSVDFSHFIHNASYWITSIACFSIWDDECKGLESDFEGCELQLWQMKKTLQIASKKNSIIIVNNVYTDTQKLEKKDISYGMFKVFYENFFEILNPYIQQGLLLQDERFYLEKQLLFSFFFYWLIQQELKTTALKCSQTENLKKAIWKAYYNKPYWPIFLLKYHRKVLSIRCRRVINKMLKRRC